MIGAGVFAAVGPAAEAAGSGLLIGLAIAAAVAYCNATSSAELAAVYPASGGTYVYGRERLGPFWGYLAGWGFVVGKTASCAAMALTVGAYAAPTWQRPIAVAAVVGAHRRQLPRRPQDRRRSPGSSSPSSSPPSPSSSPARPSAGPPSADHFGDLGAGGVGGILRSAGLLFFAFAGYARIATLGEEVDDPARTIPKAIPRALGITLVVYAVVAVSALAAVGPAALAGSDAPLATAVRAGDLDALVPAVRIGGAIAALGVLLSLIAGVSRTTFAMAADRELPGWLDAVHPTHQVPYRAELAAGALDRAARHRSPTCAAPSASARSACSRTTPSPTPRPGRCRHRSVAGRERSPPAGSSAAPPSPSPCPSPASWAARVVLAIGTLIWVVRHRLPMARDN